MLCHELSFCDTWNVTLLQPIRVTNAKNPLRLTLCVGVCRPPNRSAPDSARSQLRGSFHAVFSASQSPACSSRHPSREIWLGPSSRQSGLPGCETTDLLFRPIQVFKSEANSWSCRQPGPLVTHAPSLTIGNIQASQIHRFFYELVVRLKDMGTMNVWMAK